jgi:hypothetical protein
MFRPLAEEQAEKPMAAKKRARTGTARAQSRRGLLSGQSSEADGNEASRPRPRSLDEPARSKGASLAGYKER